MFLTMSFFVKLKQFSKHKILGTKMKILEVNFNMILNFGESKYDCFVIKS